MPGIFFLEERVSQTLHKARRARLCVFQLRNPRGQSAHARAGAPFLSEALSAFVLLCPLSFGGKHARAPGKWCPGNWGGGRRPLNVWGEVLCGDILWQIVLSQTHGCLPASCVNIQMSYCSSQTKALMYTSSFPFHRVILDTGDGGSPLYCWHFFISCWWSIVHSPPLQAAYLPRLCFFSSPSLEFDMTKISHSIMHPTVDFLWASHTRAGTIYGSPWAGHCDYTSCLHRRHSVVLTNPQMHLSFFPSFLRSLFFFLNVFFPPVLHENASLWLAECSLPACLWTACVPWACPRRCWLFFFFLACLSASSYTRDEQVAASQQTPAQKL